MNGMFSFLTTGSSSAANDGRFKQAFMSFCQIERHIYTLNGVLCPMLQKIDRFCQQKFQ